MRFARPGPSGGAVQAGPDLAGGDGRVGRSQDLTVDSGQRDDLETASQVLGPAQAGVTTRFTQVLGRREQGDWRVVVGDLVAQIATPHRFLQRYEAAGVGQRLVSAGWDEVR